jgi:putative alpha-1,2-mannosidase
MAAVGSSFVCRDKARANMLAELGSKAGLFDLEAVREKVAAVWEEKLSVISWRNG